MRCSLCNRSKGAMEHEGVQGVEERCLCGTPWGEKVGLHRDLQRVRPREKPEMVTPGSILYPGHAMNLAMRRPARPIGALEAFALLDLWLNYREGVYIPDDDAIVAAFDFAERCMAEARRREG